MASKFDSKSSLTVRLILMAIGLVLVTIGIVLIFAIHSEGLTEDIFGWVLFGFGIVSFTGAFKTSFIH